MAKSKITILHNGIHFLFSDEYYMGFKNAKKKAKELLDHAINYILLPNFIVQTNGYQYIIKRKMGFSYFIRNCNGNKDEELIYSDITIHGKSYYDTLIEACEVKDKLEEKERMRKPGPLFVVYSSSINNYCFYTRPSSSTIEGISNWVIMV